MLRLRDIMTTDVVTVDPDSTLRDTMELFAKHHISGAPVVQGERVIGVISASDILAFAAEPPGSRIEDDAPEMALDAEAWEEERDIGGEPWPGSATEDAGEGGSSADPLTEATVAEAMTWGIYALPPAANVAAAAECMRSADVHRMLVMEEGRLLGIVTTMDLVRAVAGNRIVRRTFVFDRPGNRD